MKILPPLLSLFLSPGCFFVAQCGDNITQDFNQEECDDGDTSEGDGCSALCLIEFCGDGKINNSGAPEECDDGDLIDEDGCDSNCTITRCGNGVITTGEECDDGDSNANEADACRLNCALPKCGDTIVDSDDGCDDGNNINTDACTNICVLPVCGDGIVTFGEFCGFLPPIHVAVGASPTSIVAGDFDGDDNPELAVTAQNDDSVTILQVDDVGVLTFAQSITVDDEPQFILASDLSLTNNSPDQELIVIGAGITTNTDRMRVLANTGGTFSAGVSLAAGASVEGVLGNFRNNNVRDLVTVDRANTVRFFANTGSEFFGLPSPFSIEEELQNPSAIVSADFNGDGEIDIAVSGESTNNIAFLLNDGAGVLSLLAETHATLSTPSDLAIQDLGGTNTEELVVINNTGSNEAQIFSLTKICALGNDCLTLTSTSVAGSNPKEVKLADMNNDGVLDVVVANITNLIRILFVDETGAGGNPVFSTTITPEDITLPAGSVPVDLVLVDLNGDGVLDIVTANQLSNNVSVFLSQP